jgi:hypothetical protein
MSKHEAPQRILTALQVLFTFAPKFPRGVTSQDDPQVSPPKAILQARKRASSASVACCCMVGVTWL